MFKFISSGQKGFSLISLLMAMGVIAIIGTGAGYATGQFVKAPGHALSKNSLVKTELESVNQDLYQSVPGSRAYNSGYSMWDFALVALINDNDPDEDEITLKNTTVNGNAYSEGSIGGNSNGIVNGMAFAKETIEKIVVNPATGKMPENDLDLTPPEYPDSSEGLPDSITEDISFTSGTNNHLGPLHIPGDLTISGTAKVILDGAVWVDGTLTIDGENGAFIEGGWPIVADYLNISVTNNSSYNDYQHIYDAAKLPLIVFNEVIKSNKEIKQFTISAVLYSKNSIDFQNHVKVFGAVWATQLASSNAHMEIVYLAGLNNRN